MSNRGDEAKQPLVTEQLQAIVNFIQKHEDRRLELHYFLLQAIKANDSKKAKRLACEMNCHSREIAIDARTMNAMILAESDGKSPPKDVIEDSESSAADQDLSKKREGGKPRHEPGVFQSSLVDFQDRIILLALAMAKDGEHRIGHLIVDKVCADAVAQRVVEAYHRQHKSVDEAIQGLKDLYASA